MPINNKPATVEPFKAENDTGGIKDESFSTQMMCDVPVTNYITKNISCIDGIAVVTEEEKCCDKETQTNPIDLDYSLDRGLFLKNVQKLQTEIKDLRLSLAKANTAVQRMNSIFTEGQIKKMMYPSNIVKWKWPDISNAICLHASGPRAYNHLYKKGFPLPHVSTLQRWCGKIDISEGILTAAIDFMKQISKLEPEEKICVLAFDEMKVMETFEYDQVADSVKKPVNYVQVVIAH